MEPVIADFPYVVRSQLADLASQGPEALAIVLEQHATWVRPPNEYNFLVRSEHPFFARLYDRFLAECDDYFLPLTPHQSSTRRCWAYVQDCDIAHPVWHDHLASATVNGVYYLSVPDPTGQIWFQHLERVFRVTPKQGWLYLFPSWLAHKPTPQVAKAKRVSLNVELVSVEYPITRASGLRW